MHCKIQFKIGREIVRLSWMGRGTRGLANQLQFDKLARCRYAVPEHPLKFLEALTNDIPDYSVRRPSNAVL